MVWKLKHCCDVFWCCAATSVEGGHAASQLQPLRKQHGDHLVTVLLFQLLLLLVTLPLQRPDLRQRALL